MNHIYKVIWNKTTQSLVVVSELCKAKGKTKSRTSGLNVGKLVNSHLIALSLITSGAAILGGTLYAPEAWATSNNYKGISIGYISNGYVIETNAAANASYYGRNDSGTLIVSYRNPGSLSYENASSANTNNDDYSSYRTWGVAIGNGSNAISYDSTRDLYFSNGIAIGDLSTATGGSSVSIGGLSKATGQSSMALGIASYASGFNSLAMMRNSAAVGNYSAAIGTTAWANGTGSVAMGASATAKGHSSIAIGSTELETRTVYSSGTSTDALTYNGDTNTQSIGDRSIAIGTAAKTNGDDSLSLGSNATTGNFTTSSGNTTAVVDQAAKHAIAIGSNAHAMGVSSFAIGGDSTAKNDKAVAFGVNSTATGEGSIAFGTDTVSNGSNAVAIGLSANSTGQDVTAIGSNAQAAGDRTSAIGANAIASGTGASAVGANAQATGEEAAAVGGNARALGAYDVAVGGTAKTAENHSNQIAIGYNAETSGDMAVAIGEGSRATANETMAFGRAANASVSGAIAFGLQSTANGTGALAFGQNTISSGVNSIALGATANATTDGAIAIGDDSQATNSDTLALGKNTRAKGEQSTAVGNSAQALQNSSTALGNNANASAVFSTALGTGTKASNNASTALGNDANASGFSAFAASLNASASGYAANAIGFNAVSSNQSTIAFGTNSTAAGERSISLGYNTTTTFQDSVAMGTNASAVGSAAVAIGAESVAKNDDPGKTNGATAIGSKANATGNQSVAIGAASKSGEQATAIGNDANAYGFGSIVIGGDDSGSSINNDPYASGSPYGFIDTKEVYRRSVATGVAAVAVGVHAQSLSNGSTAIGVLATAGDETDTATNVETATAATEATAIGALARARNLRSTAIGYQATSLGDHGSAIGSNATANSADSMAMGSNSTATGEGSLAAGFNATTEGLNALAIGSSAQALAENAISIGTGNIVTGKNSGAIGDPTTISGEGSYSLGNNNTIPDDNSTVIGNNNVLSQGDGGASTSDGSHVMGNDIKVRGTNSTAIGNGAVVGDALYETGEVSTNATAIGTSSKANGVNTLAIGTGATAYRTNNTAIGTGANVERSAGTDNIAFGSNTNVTRGSNNVVIGKDSKSDSSNGSSIALGNNASVGSSVSANGYAIGTNAVVNSTNGGIAFGTNASITNSDGGGASVAIGENASATGTSSISIGYNANTSSSQKDSIAIGTNATTTGLDNIAIGKSASASGSQAKQIVIGSNASATSTSQYSSVMGSDATASREYSTVLGANASSSVDGAVALGANSISNRGAGGSATGHASTTTPYIPETANATQSDAINATIANTGAVSVGSDTVKRQIINVAAGSEDSDAVNVAQLKAAISDVNTSWNIQENGTQKDVVNAGDNVSFADGTGTTANVSVDSTENTSTVTYSVNQSDLTVASDGTVSAVENGNNFATAEQVAKAINDSEKTTTVNSTNGTIVATANTTGTVTNYDLDLSQSTKDDIQQGVDANTTVSKGFDINGDNNAPDNVQLGETVDFKGDSNIITTVSDNAIAFALNSSIAVENVTVNDTFKAGDVTINNSGIDAGNTTITNVANGTNASDAVNLSQLNASKVSVEEGNNVNITSTTDANGTVYTVNANASTVSNGSDKVTVTPTDKGNNVTDYAVDLSDAAKDSLDKADSALQNLTTSADGNKAQTLDKDNTNANFISGDNIKLTASADGITVATADDVTFNNVTVNDTFKAGDVTINNSGIDAGNHTITNVANGTQDSDAVNLSQLNATNANVANNTQNITNNANNITNNTNTINKGINFGNGTSANNFALGDIINVTSDSNLVVSTVTDGVKLTLADSITVGNVTVNDTFKAGDVTINNSGIDAGNTTITNVANGTNAGDAVNLSQLNASKVSVEEGNNVNITSTTDANGTVYTVNANASTVSNGSDKVTVTPTDKGNNVTDYAVDLSDAAKDSLDKADSALQNLTTSADGNKAQTLDKDNTNANFISGDNIKLTASADGITVATADDVTFNNVTVNDTFKAGDVTINNSGIDAGNHTITNVANGTNATDAVNLSQLEKYIGDNSYNWNLSDGTNSNPVPDDGTVAITGSANGDSANTTGIVTGLDGTNVSVDLSDKAKEDIQQGVDANTTVSKGFDINGDNNAPDNVQLGETVDFKGDSNIITTVSDNAIAFALNSSIAVENVTVNDTFKAGDVTINNSGIDAGNTTITNVANGTNAGDAVNLSQLNASKVSVEEGNNVNITSTTDANGTVYTVNANASTVSNGSDKVTVTPTDKGNNVTDYAVDLSDAAKDSLDKADSALQNLTTSADGNKAQTLDKDNTNANFISGDNIKLTASADGITVATADDVTFNNVTVNDTFKAGDVTINNSGIDAGNHTITNVANGTQDSDAVNLSQLNATNANVANNTQNITNNANNITNNTNAIANNTQNITNNTNTINKGINFGNGTSANNFALGDTINVTSDSNLVVSTVTDGVKLTLADSITVGNVTVNDTFKAGDVTINNSGIDAGNHTITNVANGTQDSDAVNLSQLNASKVSVEEGNNVNITSTTDANGTVYTVNANASTVSNGSDKVTVTPTDKGNNVTDYAVDLSDAAKDSLDKADSALQSWTAQVNGADAKVVNQTSSTVDFIDGSNINITNEGGKIKVSTANEVTFNNVTVNDTFKAGDVTINNSGIDAGNTTITNVANGTNATDAVNLSQLEKYIGDNSYNWNLSDGTNSNPVPDDGTVAITGSANGDSANTTGIVTGLDGTNVSVDLSDKAKEDIQQGVDANTTVSKGFDINGDNNAPDNVQLGETVDFKGDSNIITTVSDNAIAFALNSSIAVENVTVNDTFKAGDVTINNSGIDAGNHTITNVANGTNATDAVNVAQLEANTTRYYSVNSNVSGNRNNDGATGANAMAAGANAAASGENATAIGYGTKANSAAAVAIGSNANATSSKGDSVIAIGNNAQSTGSYTIAIGTNSVANHTWSMAMGINAKAIDDYATALGSSAQATSQWATALGAGANATESAATAVGSNASASADGATVIGYSSSVTGANTTALGNHINVNTAGSVVLGNSSAAAEATTETTATVNNLTYSGFAGADNIATGDYVSIGSAGQERQIKNVAPGNISATSTDAINGSQLHATNQVLGNVTDSVVNNFGGNAAVDQNGNITFTDIGGTGETTIHDAIKNVSDVANTGWNVQTNGDTATKVAPGDTVQFKDGKNINITRTDKDITVATADDVDFNSVNTSTLTAGPVTINNNGIDAGDTKITNVSKGTEDSDAVNFAQLKDYVGDNSYNWNLSDGTNSNPVPDDGTVAITGSANGDSANTTGIVTALDGTNVSVDLSDKAKDSLDKADTAIQTLTTSADGVVAQTLSKDDNNANFTSGKNIVLTPSATGIAIATADNVTFDTVNATTFNAGDVVINQDGINAGNHTITNVAPGVNGTDAVNVDQLREVNATANAGWNLTTNGQNSSNVAPNATVDLANTDGNINITNDGTNVTFGLNSNLTVGGKDGKDGQIGVKGADGKDGITITPDTIVFNGVNGKDGVDGQSAISVNGVDGKDGVNGTTITRIEYTDPNTNTTQTVATLEDGLKFTGNNNGTVNSHTLNSLVNIVGEGVSAEAAANFTSAAGNINVVADGTDTLTVQLAKELTNLTSAVFGGDTTINGEGVTISNGTAGSDVSLTKEGLDNGNNTITNVATGVNGTDAVNVDQLTQTITDNAYNWHISDGTNTTDVPDDGTVAVKGSANADSANVSGIVTTLDGTDVSVDLSDKAKDSLDKADTAIQTLTTSADGVVAQTLNKDDNNANFTSGKNIVLTPSATGIAIATADNVTFDTVNATTFNAGDVVINQDGINAGNHTITNVAPGVNGTDAVNVDQLREVNATANAGWNLTTNGQNSSNVAPNATVDLANTDGNINITNDGNNVTFGLNSNLTVGGKDGKDGQIGVKGADGKDGITITKDAIVYHGVDGADGTSSIGVNGKDGKAGVDGTNITRIEYTDPNGTNHTVATLEDGLKFTGNNNGTVNSHTLNSLVNIVGEGVSAEAAANFTSAAGNINVVADGTDTLTVQLAKELTNLTSAVFGGDTTINGEGVTISNGTAGSDVSLTKEGLDNGNNTITNVATGVNGTDAVNVDQLTQTITDNAYNWHISNGTNTTDVPDDGTVAVKGSANADSANVSGIVTTLDGTDVSVDLSDKAKDSLDKADTAIQTLTTSADGVVAQTLNKDDNNANFTSGKNIVLTPSATGIAIATADNVTFDTVNATTFNAGDVVINQDGINAGNHTITNVAAGVNGTDAVNVDQLREVNATANAGWNLTTNGQNSSNVAPNATVDLANTDGNINITNDGTNVTFDLNSNLTVGGKDGKDGQIGAMGANGTGVVLNGKDGTIGIDGKDGTNGTVTLAQGPAGVDGVNGTDRIVYETPNGTSTVATLDDGLIFAGNNNDTLNRHKLNTQVNIVGEGVDKDTSANFTSAAGNINVVADGNSTLVVQLAQDLVNLTSATFTNGTTNTVVNGNGVTINGGDNGTVSLTDTGLNNGNNTITNVAAGQNGTDAVNVDQLREVNATANAGWNLTTNGQNSSNVAPNATVDLANTDGNINITNDGTNVTFGLNSNLTVGGKDGKDGQIGVKGADGKDGITITKDAIVYHGVDGADGTSSIGVNGKDGKAGVDGTNITRIEYTDPNGTNHTVATLEDGLKFTGNNNGTVNNHTLNSLVNIVGEGVSAEAAANFTSAAGNINVVADGTDTLTIQLAQNLTNLTGAAFTNGTTNTVVIDGTTGKVITGNVSISKDGLDNGGNKIINVAAGTNDTDAVNVSQLNASTAANAWKITGNNDDANATIVGNQTVSFNNGSNTVAVVNGTNVTFDLADNIALTNNGSMTIGSTVITNGNIKVGDNVTVTDTGFTAGNVSVTTSGINAGGNTITNVAPGVNGTDAVNVDQLNAVNATANAGWNLTANGNNSSNVKPNDTVDLANKDGNVNITKDGSNVTFDLSDTLNIGSGANTVVIDGTTGKVSTGDASISKDGISAGNQTITNVAAGTNGTDAVNVDQLREYTANVATQPLTFAGDTGTPSERKLGSTVTVKGGVTDTAKLTDNNIGVVSDGQGTLNVKLAKDLSGLNSVTISNGSASTKLTTVTKTNVEGKEASALDVGGNQITNVAPGEVSKNSTDAVNGSQLHATNQQVIRNANAINQVAGKVHSVDRKLRAGVAGALASGGLYHATSPGKSMVAAGAGTYRGESAIAVGYSRLSDNGKLGVKFSVNSNTRGDAGAAASIGYQW